MRANAPGPRGILHLKAGERITGHLRHLPAVELRAFVEHYWAVHWDLRGQPPQRAETLPHPSVQWLTDPGRSAIQGVPTGRFSRELKDQGRVFGVKFTPGGFYPFFRSPLSGFTDDFLTLGAVFGAEGTALGKRLRKLALVPDNDAQMMDVVERFLLARLPEPDARLATVLEILTTIRTGQEITKVEQVTGRFGMGLRSLQRLFSQYVGVSPKWVIKRYRLHEAVERVAAGFPPNWPQLALELGYFDQTHFIKDFRALVGKTPAEYARGVHG